MTYISSKTYPFCGSTCFRQWRSNSHCNLIHGYSLSVHFEFIAETLDDRNWVQDFGSLKPLKAYLDYMLDHTMLVAVDDPNKIHLTFLQDLGLADIRVLPAVGCEALAKHFHWWVNKWLAEEHIDGRVTCGLVEVREHERNSAAYGV